MPRRVPPAPPPLRVSVLTAIGATVAILYFAQEVLIPLVLAVLLAFLLAPLATRLERRGFHRVASVALVVTVAFTLIFALGWVVGKQVVRLAENLPAYQGEIVRKVERIRGQGGGIGSKIFGFGEAIERATVDPPPPAAPATQSAVPPAPGTSPRNPLYTVDLPEPVSPIKTLGTYLGLALGPLGTLGLVIVFVVFMLLEREDLRDRIIRLVSRGRYMVTTRAIDDAATRISRYMLAQSLVNGTYGLAVAIGLWVIGLTLGGGTIFPSFILWGLLCALLRFIPYVGPWIAAAFPIALSIAVYPGFGVFAATAGMFVVIELLSNNVMEPWLYGSSTGISAVAVLVAAVFWTWLWGPVGLLLSTPLTVCLVVLGKHVSQLAFFDVLLGDQPALPPAVSYYQRLLAGDVPEAARVVFRHVQARGIETVFDEVFIPALAMARRDRRDGGLTAENEEQILDETKAILDGLQERAAATHAAAAPAPDVAPRVALVLGCPAHHRAEELTLQMLAVALGPEQCRVEVVSTRALPVEVEARVEQDRPDLAFIAVLPPGGVVQSRYLSKRLRKRFPELKIVVGYWGRPRSFDRLLVRLRTSGASYVTTSILQSRSQVRSLLALRSLPSGETRATFPAVGAAAAAEQ
jgi:predicted PurR-regulated permease PerM